MSGVRRVLSKNCHRNSQNVDGNLGKLKFFFLFYGSPGRFSFLITQDYLQSFHIA